MAQAAAAKNTSLVKNTAGRVDLKGNTPGAKSNGAKRGTATKKASGSGSNTGRGSSTKKTTRNNQNQSRYTRNTAAAQGSDIAGAFVGAFIIHGFKELVKYFVPAISSVYLMIATGATGLLFGFFGRKIPLVGKYSGTIAKAMYLSTAIDVVSEYAFPKLLGVIKSTTESFLPGAAVPAGATLETTTTNTAGELGYVYRLKNGDRATVWDKRSAAAAMGYGNQGAPRQMVYLQ